MQDSWKFMEISSRNLVLFDTKRWEIEFSFKTRTREEDRNVVGACTRGPSGWFPLTRQINKVVFAAPSSFQESGTESVASLAADFRSPRLPHLLRVLLARFPGQTTIEHIHSPFIRSSTTCHPNCYIFSHQCFRKKPNNRSWIKKFPLKSKRYCEISPDNRIFVIGETLIRGGFNFQSFNSSNSPESLRRAFENSLKRCNLEQASLANHSPSRENLKLGANLGVEIIFPSNV